MNLPKLSNGVARGLQYDFPTHIGVNGERQLRSSRQNGRAPGELSPLSSPSRRTGSLRQGISFRKTVITRDTGKSAPLYAPFVRYGKGP
jgi:hypothetical protein